MSAPLDPTVHPPLPPPAAPARRGLSGCFLGASLLLNLVAVVTAALLCGGGYYVRTLEDSSYPETHVSGEKSATDKVAIVNLDGIIMDGLMEYPHQQIEKAAKDGKVKAVVLRINSPGGSVTASAELYRRVVRLREGDDAKGYDKKPVVVSMGSVAASGGYYVAVAGETIYAEETTATGSIGVYLTLFDVTGIEGKTGVHVELVKAGEIKAAGSMFEKLDDKDRLVLKDMVDDAYVQFLDVIKKGRPQLTREKMLTRFQVEPINPDPHLPKMQPYQRYRADGGTFNGPTARKLELVDEIGGEEDAIKAAAKSAGLSSYKTIKYSKPKSLTDLLTARAEPPPSGLELGRLEQALMPRLWHLAPGYEAAALTAAARAAR